MKPRPSNDPAALRRAAEARLKKRLKKRPAAPRPPAEADLRRFQHELEVHQIELELQNQELRSAREKLAADLERYTDLYDFASVGYLNLAADGTIRLVNLAGARLVGLERARLVGRRFGLLVAGPDRPAFSAFLARVFAGEARPTCDLTLAVEDQPPRIVCLEAALSPDGRESLVALLDITQRDQARAALAASERRLRAIFDNEPECVKLLAADGSLLEMNPAGLRMLEADSLEQIHHHCVYPLVAEEHRAAFRELTANVFRGESGALEFQVLGLKGGRRWLETHATPLRDASGAVTALLGLTRDITARKQAEAARDTAHRRADLLARLGRGLAEATTTGEAALLIVRAADELMGWDACWLHLWHAHLARFESVLNFDLVDGQKREVPANPLVLLEPSAIASRVMVDGAQLLLREGAAEPAIPLQPFGSDRRSRSLMFVPMQHHGALIGILSIQSYRARAYDPAALAVLQGLADHCAGALARIRGEAALLASEERFSKAFRFSPDPIALWRLADGHITDVNESFERASGFQREELIGRSGWESSLWVRREDRDRYVTAIRERRRLVPFEAEFRVKSGGHRVGLVSGDVLELGGEAHALAIIHDITERKRAETALRESEEKYRSLVERMGEGLLVVDNQDVIQFVNRRICDLLGFTADELLGRNASDLLLRPEEHERMRQRNRERERGLADSYELQIRRKSGEFIWCHNSATPVRGGDGAVTGSMAIMADITARKQDEALIQGQKQVLEMIAGGARLEESLAALVRLLEMQGAGMLCSILLLEADGVHLRHGAALSLPEEYTRAIDGVASGPAVGSCGTAVFRREAVIVEDIATDPLWADYRELALAHGLRACWSTPIFDGQRRVLGTFAMYYRQPGRPTARHLQLVDIATQTAAIAIGRQRAEAALRVSESRHRRLIEANIIGVTIANTDGRITEANDLFLRMVGRTREDLEAGRVRWDAMTPPEWRAVDEHIFQELQARGVCAPVEKEYVRPDGSRVPILASVALLEGGPGDCICLIADMTERRRTEAEVERQRAELQLILDAVPALIYYKDHAGRFLRVNRSLAEAMGLPPEAFIGQTDADLGSRFAEQYRADDLQVMTTGTPVRQREEPLQAASGHRWLLTDKLAYRDETGRATGIIGLSVDITARKEAEAALRESERRMSTLFHGSPAAICVNTVETGRLIDANEQFVRFIGFGREELVGRTVFDLKLWVNPEARGAVMSRLKAGQPVRHVEAQFRRKNGDVRDVLVSCELIRLAGESDPVTVSMFLDVTERKRAEAALRRHEEILRLFAEHSPAAIAMFDREMKYLVASRRYLLDYRLSAESLVGRPHYEVFPEMPDRWKEVHRRCLAGAVEKAEEDPFPRADGRLDWVRWEIRPWHEPDGGIGGLILFSEVITGRKEAEAALRETQRQLTSLIANLPGVVYRCRNDANWTTEFVSEGILQLFGYPAADFMEHRREIGQLIYPDDQGRVWEEIQTALRERRRYELTYRITTAGGGEKWLWEQGAGVFEAGGTLRALEGFVTDITERKRSEEAATERNKLAQQISMIATTAPGALASFRLRPDGSAGFPYASPAWLSLFALTQAEVSEDTGPLLKRIHPDDVAHFQETIQQSARSMTDWRDEFRILHPSRGELWVEGHSTPIREADGSILWHGFITDITERRQAEQKLVAQLDELRRWHEVMLGREERAMELKREVNELLTRLGEPPRYPSQSQNSGSPKLSVS